MRSQRLKTGIPEKDATEASVNTILTKTIRTKEKVRKKTRGLWDTARQLKGLSDLLANPEGESDKMPGWEGLSIKPTVKPADNLLELKTENAAASPTDRSLSKPKVNMVKSSSMRAVKTTAKTTKKNEKKPKEKTSLKIIVHKEKPAAESPVKPAKRVADISAREILKELKNIEKLIRERQPKNAIKPENRKG